MRQDHTIAVIIPVLNEEASIGRVLDDIPAWVDDIVVADNGSTDGTAAVARDHGARVVHEPRRGYGSACLRGMAHLENPDIVVFLDGDYSDYPEDMDTLVAPILTGEVDLVIGSRVLGDNEPGALTPQAAFGNWLATRLMRLFWGVRYTDLGPFRAIRYRTLLELGMADPDYGWTVEMQIRAALQGVPHDEVTVRYRKRIGLSKVSGTVRGVVGAGTKILGTIFLALVAWPRTRKTRALVVFSRYPVPGATKTRLIPALGAEGAAAQQRAMTEHTLQTALPFGLETLTQVRYTGGSRHEMRDWLGPRFEYVEQGGGDLGERMLRAFTENFAQACGKVVIIGTDCPALDACVTHRAFLALDDHDLVIGPASDGGYYLIGLRIHAAGDELSGLFQQIEWGGEHVRRDTLANAKRLGLSVGQLDVLDDIDYAEDLPAWDRVREVQRISVIIPALNEAGNLPAVLERLAGADNLEVIVVDGGSDDGTPEVAGSHGAKVIGAPRGRARQMNAGARVATGGILLFLHADTLPPEDFDGLARRLLSDPAVALGAFRLCINARGLGYRFIEAAVSLRNRLASMPYGDQAYFLRRELFEAVGGFPEEPAMEDYLLVKRLRRRGVIVTLPACVFTSPRRWQREGLLRTTIRNVVAYWAYPLGVSPARIARWLGRG